MSPEEPKDVLSEEKEMSLRRAQESCEEKEKRQLKRAQNSFFESLDKAVLEHRMQRPVSHLGLQTEANTDPRLIGKEQVKMDSTSKQLARQVELQRANCKSNEIRLQLIETLLGQLDRRIASNSSLAEKAVLENQRKPLTKSREEIRDVLEMDKILLRLLEVAVTNASEQEKLTQSLEVMKDKTPAPEPAQQESDANELAEAEMITSYKLDWVTVMASPRQLKLRKGARALSVYAEDGVIVMPTLHKARMIRENIVFRNVRIVGNNLTMSVKSLDNYEFVGTVQVCLKGSSIEYEGAKVWHVFLEKEPVSI